jgi:UDP-N-acetylmuramate--alanine ligase
MSISSLPQPGSHIHLVGIGGTGLSAIARLLLQKGHRVSGSDRTLSLLAEGLAREGATVYGGHDAANLTEDVDAVIVTSAVKDENPEIAAALARGIPVYKRSDIMASLMEGKRVIAVAGSHGKTTTTAMIVRILVEMGRHPSYIIGGTLKTTGTNAAWDDEGDVFVVEADEYDYMFLGLRPDIAVVTNVEWDHPDFFKTAEDFHHAFEQFVDLLPEGGILIADPSSIGIQALIAHVDAQGREGFADSNLQDFPIYLQVPGMHNLFNARLAIRAAERVGVARVDAMRALESFTGTARRFELKDEIDGIAVIDDYAHNPTKIRSTIQAARSRYPDREIWAVWQPHTYSRTQTFLEQYLTAFDQADHVLVTEIYAAREQPIPGVTSAAFVEKLSHADVRHTPTLDDAVETLLRDVQAPAVILIMSAGDATRIADMYLKRMNG